jgi:uncharacterized protein YjbJ (UPF0337 family)
MTFNQDVIQGKWREIKGEIRKAWGRLTDDELEKTKGDMTAIGGLVQQRYGHEKSDVDSTLGDIYGRFVEAKDEKVDSIKESLRN